MKNRVVTEADFRLPEFKNAIPEDYEFRMDGKLARKDRWGQGIRDIAGLLGMSRTAFEIKDIVEGVRKLI